jgi:hypothetical protein
MGSKKGSWIVIEMNGECTVKNKVQVCVANTNTQGLRSNWQHTTFSQRLDFA